MRHRLTNQDALPQNQYLPDDDGLFPVPEGERMPADPSIFSIDEEQIQRPSLLRNVRVGRQAARQRRRQAQSPSGALEPEKE